uniref:Nucleotide-diphospho-sugar transferase domain-containing protein n=1 Tax=Strongyloides stercoralis TaxID=6248 RepID=A0A0K0EAH5_STRER
MLDLRHCLLYNFALQVKDDIKYIVFVDGDIGVVNPLHRIEKYLPKNEEEIFFYDRTFNYEIMAGSYIVRNNFYGRMFINSFANYEFKVPEKNDGTDNVALQAVVLDFLNPISHPNKYRKCLAFYKFAKGFDLNMAFVSCMRHILELIDETPSDPDYHTYDKGKFKILRKLSSQRWAR